MSEADAIVLRHLAGSAAEADADAWRRLLAEHPEQARAALLLLHVDGLLLAGTQAPPQAAAVLARLDAQVGRRIRSSVMGELQRNRRGRWRTSRSGRHIRSRPVRGRFLATLAIAAGLAAAVGLALLGPWGAGTAAIPTDAARLVEMVPPLLLDGVEPLPGTVLPQDGRLQVGPGGRGVIAWADGSRAIIDPASTLTLPGTEAGKRLRLDHGQVAATVAHQPSGRPLVVATPHGEAVVVGTRLRLTVDAASTRLAVDEGLVRLVARADGSVQEVGAGRTGIIVAPLPTTVPTPSADLAARPDLDLVHLVGAAGPPAASAPLLVAGMGRTAEHQSVVRVFDRRGLCQAQFLVWPPAIHGGVEVAGLRWPGTGAAIACAAGDPAASEVRIVDCHGAALAAFIPPGLRPPYAIASGRFLGGQEQIAVASRHGSGDLLLCRPDGQVLERWPLPGAAGDLVLLTQRDATGDRLLYAAAPGAPPRLLGPDGDDGAAPATADARDTLAAWHPLRRPAGRLAIHAADAPIGETADGLWQLGPPGAAAQERLRRLAMAWRSDPAAFAGVMPGPLPIASPRTADGGAATLLAGARDAILAGFPAGLVLLPAEPFGTDGQTTPAAVHAPLFAAGTGLAVDLPPDDPAAADPLIAALRDSGHGDPLRYHILQPQLREGDRLLNGRLPTWEATAASATAAEPARRLPDGGWLLRFDRPGEPPLLAGSGSDAMAPILFAPFRTRIVCEPLWPDAMAPAAAPLLSPPVRDLGPGDLIEIAFQASADLPAMLRVQAVGAGAGTDAEPIGPVHDVALTGKATACRLALRFQIPTAALRIRIAAVAATGDGATPAPRIAGLRSAVHRSGIILPDADRTRARPYRGGIAWDVLPR